MTFRRTSRFAAPAFAAAILAAPLALQPAFFAGPAEAQGAPGSFADIVEAAKPAVVTIATRATLGDRFGAPGLDPEGSLRDFMDRFFGRQPGQRRAPTPGPRRESSGLGSGFVIGADGVIVTNNHVVENASEVTVLFDDGTELAAEVLGVDDKTDLAVLKVRADAPLPTVAWGDSDTLRVGDWVVAIGNPFGLGGSVTAGIVSARGRDIRSGPYDDYIQIDAAINRGNSGGPLFDTEGRVVGVNTAIFSPNGGNIGLGFAIPANQARRIVRQLQDGGEVERGRIGVMIQPVNGDLAEGLGLPQARGALVASVEPGSPAEAAGVHRGDVILGYGAAEVDTVRDLTRAVAATEPGRSQTMTVWRRGEEIALDVVVGRMGGGDAPAFLGAEPSPPSVDPELAIDSLGLSLRDLDHEARAQYGYGSDATGALVAGVNPSKSAAEKGLRAGDLIVAVGQTEVEDAAHAEELIVEAVASGRKTVTMLIERDGGQRFVAVPVGDS